MESVQIPPSKPWEISADGTIVWTGVLKNKLRVQIRYTTFEYDEVRLLSMRLQRHGNVLTTRV
jgi:hypothetical protein